MRTYKSLTEEQILQIPALVKDKTIGEVAKHLQVHTSTVGRWIGVLRKRGIKVETLKGRPVTLK